MRSSCLVYVILFMVAFILAVGIVWYVSQSIGRLMNASTASKVDKIKAVEEEPLSVGKANQLEVLVKVQFG